MTPEIKITQQYTAEGCAFSRDCFNKAVADMIAITCGWDGKSDSELVQFARKMVEARSEVIGILQSQDPSRPAASIATTQESDQ